MALTDRVPELEKPNNWKRQDSGSSALEKALEKANNWKRQDSGSNASSALHNWNAVAGEFNGCWRGEDSTYICTILNSKVEFADGKYTHLQPHDAGDCCMIFDEKVFVGHLEKQSYCNVLRWSDGDVWVMDTTIPHQGKSTKQDPVPDRPAKPAKTPSQQIENEIKLTSAASSNPSGYGDSKRETGSTLAMYLDKHAKAEDAILRQTSTMSTTKELTDLDFFESEACQYRVMQGFLVKKTGDNPTIDSARKRTKDAGALVPCTGRQWRSPTGNLWVEVDHKATGKEPGWLLVQGGAQMGIQGTLLEKVEENQEQPIILKVTAPVGEEERQFCVRASEPTRAVKVWISKMFALNISHINIYKPESRRPSNQKFVAWHETSGDDFVSDDATIESAGFKDSDTILYVYMGFLAND